LSIAGCSPCSLTVPPTRYRRYPRLNLDGAQNARLGDTRGNTEFLRAPDPA
jgi:hypothetical protein